MKFRVSREDIRHIILGISNSLVMVCETKYTMPAITLKTLSKLASYYNKYFRENIITFELDYIYAIDLKCSLEYAIKFNKSVSLKTWDTIDKWYKMLQEALESWRD